MDDHTPDTEFEARLTAGLHAMVDGEQPPPDLRQRISDGLAAPARPSRRRWLPAAAAALLVVAGIGIVAGLDGDDGGSVDVATDPSPADDTDDPTDPDVIERTTTSTTAPPTTTTEPETEVLGESTTRDPGQDDQAPAPSTAPPPTDAPAPPATDAPAPTAPPTTALVCQNSTNPECGPFRWDPAPQNRAATLAFAVPDRIVAGAPFEVRATITDPDGPVDFSCSTIANDGGGPQLGGPCTAEPQECPARYGPWSPPTPKGSSAMTTRTMQIDEPGTYTVYGVVEAVAGCDNVDPYRSGASAEITIEVVAE